MTQLGSVLPEGATNARPDQVMGSNSPSSVIATDGSSLMPIHVINLDRSPGRLAQFRNRNPHLRNIARFPAIDGQLANKEVLANEGIITDDCSYKAGTLGCAVSHVRLWQKWSPRTGVLRYSRMTQLLVIGSWKARRN